MQSRKFNAIMAVLGVAILLFLLKDLDFNYLRTFDFSLTSAGIASLILVIFAIFIVRTIRWMHYLKSIGVKIGFGDAYFAVVPSIALGLFTPAQTGDLLKIELLKRQKNIKRRESLATVLVEKAADFFLLFVIFLFSLYHFSLKVLNLNYQIMMLVAALLLIFAFLSILYFRKNIIIKNTARNIVKILSDLKSFSLAVLLTIVYWFLIGVGWYLVAKMANIDLSFLFLFGILSITSIVGLVTLVPGAIGIMEFSTVFMLTTLSDISMNQAAIFALSYRIYSILMYVVAYSHLFIRRNKN
ncbi:flippase-like domain-containing protein [Candidatus Woesearchaeota archaeon]|nr:flippase-like domain-containing protein [Candidatus Woesearchaeota archaeon]